LGVVAVIVVDDATEDITTQHRTRTNRGGLRDCKLLVNALVPCRVAVSHKLAHHAAEMGLVDDQRLVFLIIDTDPNDQRINIQLLYLLIRMRNRILFRARLIN
jgi:hypothetical protein